MSLFANQTGGKNSTIHSVVSLPTACLRTTCR